MITIPVGIFALQFYFVLLSGVCRKIAKMKLLPGEAGVVLDQEEQFIPTHLQLFWRMN